MQNGSEVLFDAVFGAPGVADRRFRMPRERERLHDARPDDLISEGLRERHAARMLRFAGVHFLHGSGQALDIAHAVSATRSPTLQTRFATPDSMAGAQRNELWTLQKL